MRVKLILALLLAAPTGKLLAQADTSSDARSSAESITASEIRARLGIIAADSMRGRDTPSPELEETARWVGSRFRSFGLEPGGDEGGYLQHYAIRTIAAGLEQSSAREPGGRELEFGRDLGFPFGPTAEGEFNGPVVVVSGSGHWREALGSADLDGRHVVVVSSPGPDGAWSGAFRTMSRAIEQEASPASIIVATNRSSAEWERLVGREGRWTQLQIGLDSWEGPPVLEIRDRALAPLLAAHGVDLNGLRERFGEDLRVDTVPDLTLSLSLRDRVLEAASAPNTVGILRGSDPELRDQFVVFSAHMDHLGVGTPDATGDSIYNGADDDGSGTVTVVELAEAFSRLATPPRRSLIFLTVSGEEKGLWGSEYFTSHPPVPMKQIVADLNMDMIGRNWTDTIVAIGRKQSDLGETLDTVASRHPELDMAAIDDPWPEEHFYTRSDHFNFARRGVPILFFFSGTHEDYHQPGDEVGKIEFDKTARIGRLVFYLGLEVADRDEPPRWDPQSYQQVVGEGH